MLKTLTFQQLEDKIRDMNPEANFALIQKAYRYAETAHQNQTRKSGEPYIQHCLWTAWHLAEMRLDSTTISAGLLHDVVDDTEKTSEDIKKEFGKEIAKLVEGITKLGKLKYRGIERHVENLRKMFLAMAEDIRVMLIKLADRLHNMQTLQILPPEKAQRIALETLDIYAPIAYRLGIWETKGKLEDLAFPYIFPEEHNWLISTVKDRYERRQKYLERIKPVLAKELRREEIEPLEIHHRAKHYFSLFKKLQRYDMNLNKIYDLVALRVIVNTVEECYTTLGIIHKIWKPLPGRIKDYIALPKPNGYQSLHTTVFCEEGKITEIQIRTKKMHEEAERGIAAHWYYAEQKGLKSYIKKIVTPAPEKKIAWIRQLQEWQKELDSSSPNEFLEALKIDFFKDRIFVFTPKGDVIDLPEGATPIDFAYYIHTDIGDHTVAAKVDGKILALDQELKNGQVVEIVTQKERNVNNKWLEFVKTSLAKSKIKSQLRKQDTPEPSKKEKPELEEEKKKQTPTPKPAKNLEPGSQKKPRVIGQETERIKIKTAQCCQPKPEEKIVGFVTQNEGVSVHKKNCDNFKKLAKKSPKKVVQVGWR